MVLCTYKKYHTIIRIFLNELLHLNSICIPQRGQLQYVKQGQRTSCHDPFFLIKILEEQMKRYRGEGTLMKESGITCRLPMGSILLNQLYFICSSLELMLTLF